MTVLQTPSDTKTETVQRMQRRDRVLIVAVVVLSVAVLVLIAWIGWGDSTSADAAVPTEIEQLIEDYDAAFGKGTDGYDPVAMREIVSEDFALRTSYYRQFGDVLAADSDVRPLDTMSLSSGWQRVEAGDLMVFGDGPWVVARIDRWSDAMSAENGIGVWVIYDDEGTLKIKDKHWIGFYGEPTISFD